MTAATVDARPATAVRQRGCRAKNTNSRPGRSGASRTSSTEYPCPISVASTSARSRKRNVESEVKTAPSAAKTYVQRKLTNGKATSVSSTQLSTAPTPGISVTAYESSRFHSRQPRWAGSRDSNARYPPGRRASYTPRSVAARDTGRGGEWIRTLNVHRRSLARRRLYAPGAA
jgi:hypothetical protein